MLVEFKIANYRSIKEEQTLSFIADKATRYKENLIPFKGMRLLRSCAIFGANASGKSNIIKALAQLAAFVKNSASNMTRHNEIPLAQGHLLDSAMTHQPSQLEVTFFDGTTFYDYFLAADIVRVHRERLTVSSLSSNKETVWYDRTFQPTTNDYAWEFGDKLNSVRDILQQRTRDNSLALSVGVQFNVTELDPLFELFTEKLAVLDMTHDVSDLLSNTTKRCHRDERFKSKVLCLLQDADIEWDKFDTEIDEYFPASDANSKGLAGVDLLRQKLDTLFTGRRIQDVTIYRKMPNGDLVAFNMHEHESEGTQRLFAVAGGVIDALERGCLLAIDELDASLHPRLTRAIVELFHSPNANKNGAQLLFTTHDVSLFNQGLFRRDQIILTEKRQGATQLFSLADFEEKPRNVESFMRNYLMGRYGGVPNLGSTFINGEIEPAA